MELIASGTSEGIVSVWDCRNTAAPLQEFDMSMSASSPPLLSLSASSSSQLYGNSCSSNLHSCVWKLAFHPHVQRLFIASENGTLKSADITPAFEVADDTYGLSSATRKSVAAGLSPVVNILAHPASVNSFDMIGNEYDASQLNLVCGADNGCITVLNIEEKI